ncbi:MAG: hypothetical protein JSW39_26095 [Desulfobacterales bacterium]|nr:MAG: hypothetical protein JSW39_26095 [Desulfobacterales bacterium]
MILSAVFLVSLSALAFEVLLTRVFSITQWNHLSFMVISIALFGFAASGTLLSILDTRKKGWEKRLSSRGPLKAFTTLYSLSAILSFIALNAIPLDYFRLPFESVQAFYLFIAYVLLALPFFFAGLIVSLAYAFLPARTGVIYFATMAGSAIGAVIPAMFLPLVSEETLIVNVAVVPLFLLPYRAPVLDERRLFGRNRPSTYRIAWGSLGLAVALTALFILLGTDAVHVNVKPSPYKALSQLLMFPDTRITNTFRSIRGRIDRVQSPYIRFAPGLSLKFTNTLPHQSAVFTDGDSQFVLYDLAAQEALVFPRFTLSYLGYGLAPHPPRVLIIQHGGGLAVPCAVASGARDITVVEPNPDLARLLGAHYRISAVNTNARTYLARTRERFDVIHVENWGTSVPGSAALNQEYFFTTDAFRAYLDHLTPDGVVIISRKLLLPPADALRLWAAAYESLRFLGCTPPANHLALLRNWDTFTLIVSARSLRNTAIIKDFAQKRNFDMVFIKDLSPELINRYNVYDKPFYADQITRLAEAYRSGTAKQFFQSYLLDVRPQSDRRPFPSHFLKWPKLRALYQSMGSRLYALLMSGEIVVVVVFLEALVVSAGLLVLPLFFIAKDAQRPPVAQIIYFSGVGAGFMFMELYFVKQYILLFENPVVSFTVVISGVLVFSSLGGLWAQRKKQSALRYALLALIGAVLLFLTGLDRTLNHVLGLPVIWRYLGALLILLPAGFLMGLPFPLGMRYILKNPAQRAYAWSVNGCASVLASIVSAQIALSLGIPIILGCAALAYILAWTTAGRG